MKILIVDDSLTIRRIMTKAVQGLGFDQIIEASNGKEALDKTQKDPTISLILCDWNMPEMSGLEFLQQFRQNDPSTPFVMVTTEAEKDRVVDAIQAGVTGYVRKPFTPVILQDKIREVMKNK